ncbi:MAG TPA: alpha/beta hydrolase [Stellaceae bacterium]|nr:alpha/beta hydrolase [Stellaceae bacterium]
MTEATHRTVITNGIRMHVAEQGAGPLVLLCHGFPESWYSWRHQLGDLAEVGFHALAPDLRGYGRTERPEAIDQYTLLRVVGDMVGLLDLLGAEEAVLAGHDWGAVVAWLAALLRPDRFRGVIALSVPFRPGGGVRPTTLMPQTDDTIFYQAPVVAEADYERDVRLTLGLILYWHSGDASRRADNARPLHMVPRQGGVFTHASNLPPLPAWLSETDLDFFAAEFGRTGFRGGLNWYRNIDRNWELLAPFAGARVTVPALFLVGERDPVLAHPDMETAILNQSALVPQLHGTIMLPGCGRWIQQERPDEVTAAMVDFIRGLT